MHWDQIFTAFFGAVGAFFSYRAQQAAKLSQEASKANGSRIDTLTNHTNGLTEQLVNANRAESRALGKEEGQKEGAAIAKELLERNKPQDP